MNVPEGANTVTVVPPANFTATPAAQTVVSSGSMNWYDAQPVCLSAINSVNDIEVTLVPLGVPKPGNELVFQVLVQNIGTESANGTITLQYDTSKLDFTSSWPFNLTQSTNTLTLDFSNLYLFETTGVRITFTVKQQPDATIGDQLVFTANVASIPPDSNLSNNTSQITQTVVNSFDPNDMIVQEGDFIEQDQADEYLHYTIRFQNEGTAAAEDILIKNLLSDQLDWSTFEPIANSTLIMRTERVGAEVSFVFAEIDLAPNPTNDPGLVRFVCYKIKPLPGFAIGDIISNQAAIYFDDNAPIMTNTVTTQIAPLGVAENELQTVRIYPNPSRDLVYIALRSVSDKVDVQIYDVQGKVILDANQHLLEDRASFDVAKIQSGIYFMKVSADGKSTVKKWIKL